MNRWLIKALALSSVLKRKIPEFDDLKVRIPPYLDGVEFSLECGQKRKALEKIPQGFFATVKREV
jgi:hypothetical protein